MSFRNTKNDVLLEHLKKGDYLSKLRDALNKNITTAPILSELKKSFKVEHPICLSIVDSKGKILESSGNVYLLAKERFRINNNLDHSLVISFSIVKEFRKKKVLIIGEDRCGKTSIVSNLIYGTTPQTLSHNMGFSSFNVRITDYDIEFKEISGDKNLLLNYFKSVESTEGFDLILYVLDNSFIALSNYFFDKIIGLKKIFDERKISFKVILTKNDQLFTEENLNGFKEMFIARQRLLDNNDIFHYSAIGGNQNTRLVQYLSDSLKEELKRK